MTDDGPRARADGDASIGFYMMNHFTRERLASVARRVSRPRGRQDEAAAALGAARGFRRARGERRGVRGRRARVGVGDERVRGARTARGGRRRGMGRASARERPRSNGRAEISLKMVEGEDGWSRLRRVL